MNKKWIVLLAAALVVGGCGNKGGEGEAASEVPGAIPGDAPIEASDYAGDAPELGSMEYRQIVEEVFQNTGAEVSWDGVTDLAGGRSFLSLSMGRTCGEGDCGKLVFLENSNRELPVQAVITIPFQVQGSPGYIARQYTLAPGEKISLGCSHLCSGEEKVEFRRAIVVARVVAAGN